MSPVGVFLVICGVLVLYFPVVIQKFVGVIFLFVGANIILGGWAMRKTGEKESFKFGQYEIFKNKK